MDIVARLCKSSNLCYVRKLMQSTSSMLGGETYNGHILGDSDLVNELWHLALNPSGNGGKVSH